MIIWVAWQRALTALPAFKRHPCLPSPTSTTVLHCKAPRASQRQALVRSHGYRRSVRKRPWRADQYPADAFAAMGGTGGPPGLPAGYSSAWLRTPPQSSWGPSGTGEGVHNKTCGHVNRWHAHRELQRRTRAKLQPSPQVGVPFGAWVLRASSAALRQPGKTPATLFPRGASAAKRTSTFRACAS